MIVAAVIYVVVSLLIGGVAMTYEIWHRPAMLDRADGRGEFPSPKMALAELIFFGMCVALGWPLLAWAMIADVWGE
jgi:hypothetical protein